MEEIGEQLDGTKQEKRQLFFTPAARKRLWVFPYYILTTGIIIAEAGRDEPIVIGFMALLLLPTVFYIMTESMWIRLLAIHIAILFFPSIAVQYGAEIHQVVSFIMEFFEFMLNWIQQPRLFERDELFFLSLLLWIFVWTAVLFAELGMWFVQSQRRGREVES